MEISSEMDTLSSHMEQALPIRKINYTSTNNNIISNPLVNSHSIMESLDKDDLEIKNLINKANELSNNNNIKKEEEIKTYEDKVKSFNEAKYAQIYDKFIQELFFNKRFYFN